MRFRGLVNKINAWARKYIFTFFLVIRVGVRVSFQQTGTVPECEKLQIENQHDKKTLHRIGGRNPIPQRKRERIN